MRLRLTILPFLLILTAVASAQTGRNFLSIQGAVAFSRAVYVGRIQSMVQIDYKNETGNELPYGKIYRLKYAVTETIRGAETKELDLVMAIQNPWPLKYQLEHHIESLLLIGNSNRTSVDNDYVTGIEEQGKIIIGDEYHFRTLDRVPAEAKKPEDRDGAQLNITYDSGQMFDVSLKVVKGRNEILKRAREFAHLHREILDGMWFRVPNEFGQQCGYSNAYCGIALPICEETKLSLLNLKKNPNLIVKFIHRDAGAWTKERVLSDIDGMLANYFRIGR
jgi:hypothetical protein